MRKKKSMSSKREEDLLTWPPSKGVSRRKIFLDVQYIYSNNLGFFIVYLAVPTIWHKYFLHAYFDSLVKRIVSLPFTSYFFLYLISLLTHGFCYLITVKGHYCLSRLISTTFKFGSCS